MVETEKIIIDPRAGAHGFQFPDTATIDEKKLFFLEVEKARITGKPLEIDGRVKVVPLTPPIEQKSAPVQPISPIPVQGQVLAGVQTPPTPTVAISATPEIKPVA